MAIKVYKSSDQGAPSITGQNGQMITLLDAILVNGYGSVSVSSITRVSATATVTTATAHGLATGDSVLIAGATQTDYNIDAVVTVTSSTTFTYTVANTPTTPATGTITAKRAPAGFTKVYSGTNKAAYRSNDVTGNRLYLRVLDDGGGTGGAQECRVFGYETMSDVDTGTNVFPTNAQSSFGYVWRKSSTSDSTPKTWIVITDGKIVYYTVQHANTTLTMDSSSTNYHGTFGDILAYKSGDVWNTVLTGSTAQNTPNSPGSGFMASRTVIDAVSAFGSSLVLARSYTAVAGAVYVGLFGSGTSTTCLGTTVAILYPHAVDNGFYVAPVVVTQGTTGAGTIRGRMPGFYECLHGRSLNNLDIVEDVAGLTGRKLMCLYGNNSSASGCVFIDITGPWDS